MLRDQRTGRGKIARLFRDCGITIRDLRVSAALTEKQREVVEDTEDPSSGQR